MKIATIKHLQRYLKHANELGNVLFESSVLVKLVNKKKNENSIPYSRTSDTINTKTIDDDLVNNLIHMGKKNLFLTDSRGSGYQFQSYLTLQLRINNRKQNLINYYFGGKPKIKKSRFILSEALEAKSDDDDKNNDNNYMSSEEEETQDDRDFINDSDIEYESTSSTSSSSSDSTSSSDSSALLKKLELYKLML